MPNYNIILASKSPRRKELLANITPSFTVKIKEVAEIYPKELEVMAVPIFLAELKAKAFLADLRENELIITSDTIVVLENTIYGKPKDRDDAIRILQALSGKAHQVITGVCLHTKEKKVSFKETTTIHFKTLQLEEIEYYIDTYKPYDKAGAYAIQEWIGMIAIHKIEGDYFNVVGLPLFRLNLELKKLTNS